MMKKVFILIVLVGYSSLRATPWYPQECAVSFVSGLMQGLCTHSLAEFETHVASASVTLTGWALYKEAARLTPPSSINVMRLDELIPRDFEFNGRMKQLFGMYGTGLGIGLMLRCAYLYFSHRHEKEGASGSL